MYKIPQEGSVLGRFLLILYTNSIGNFYIDRLIVIMQMTHNYCLFYSDTWKTVQTKAKWGIGIYAVNNQLNNNKTVRI